MSSDTSLDPAYTDIPVLLPEGMIKYRIDSADVLLRARIRRSLSATGRQQLTQIKVTAQGGRVTLHGNVPSYYMKQIAQHAAMGVEGVQQLESRLTVSPA